MRGLSELRRMMAAWGAARDAGRPAALATVVGVRGSSYRDVGARMLVVDGGERAGSVSGGCLEGDIARKAFWWLADGDYCLKTYDTEPADDGFGLGCGGSIDVLVERLGEDEGNPLVVAERVRTRRQTAVVETRFAGAADGVRSVWWGEDGDGRDEAGLGRERVFRYAVEPPLHLVVCGAGLDAQPLAGLAASLGWAVTVLDKRADFAVEERFVEADLVRAVRDRGDLEGIAFDARTAVVIMTHSFGQDRFFLEQMGGRGLRYLGLMGARARTAALLDEVDVAVAGLYAPAGLSVGAESPEEIAVAIVAEILACFRGRGGGHLRESTAPMHLHRAAAGVAG